jgi:hypothetical protein
VTGWLIVGACVWCAALMLFAAGLQWSVLPPDVSDRPATSALARQLNASRPVGTTATWAVVSATSAQRALVVEVDAVHLDQAVAIASAIVEPLRAQYAEVLVYLRRVGEAATVSRVQWTPAGGYVELVYLSAP